MTIITPTGVTGINSITSSGNSLSFQNASGASIDVSGLKVAADSMNVSGIVTATGFVGNLTGNITGNLNSSGVSTVTTLRATSIVGVTTAGITTAYIGSVNDGPISGARNRIINGDMRIDQRNAGVSTTGTDLYTLDRWELREDSDGAVSVQRSGVVPVGFTSSLLATTTTADSDLVTTQRCLLGQRIEGFNISDLNWGTSSAIPVTLSFWVRSSLTGTFSVSVSNNGSSRSYVTTYTISSANTWEYKTITIPGETTGTWLTDNRVGINVRFGLGVGPTYTTSSTNTWLTSEMYSATGSVSVIGTLNATWFVTGVQLEAGTVATPFERRSYGQELALCQRYCHVTSYDSVTNPIVFWGYWSTSTIFEGFTTFPVTMRTSPTLTIPTIGSLYALEAQVAWRQISSFSANESGPNCAKYAFTAATNASFTKGQGGAVGIRAAGTVQFSSEL